MTHDYIVCPICQSDSTTIIRDIEMGEMICGKCGLVIYDKIQETRSECHYFNTKEANNRSRTGMHFSLAHHDMGYPLLLGGLIKMPMGTS
jgi:transcription initiation factor TFIIB